MTKVTVYRRLSVVLFCFLCISSFAQRQCRLNIQPADNNAEAISELKIPETFASKNKCLAYVQQLPSLLLAKGFISASIDSVWEDSSSVSIQLFTGKKYIWDSLHVQENDWPVLNQLGFYKTSFNTKPFDQQKVNAVYESLLEYYASAGYPFAKLGLENININGNAISASLSIDRGLVYYIDTIQVYGDIKLSKNFLTHYLEIKEHDIYEQDKIDRIDQRLAELPFLNQYQPHNIAMLNTGAELNLYLQSRKSSQVNLLVGFLPADPQKGGKLLITGEANLNLKNPFGNGETLSINWQQLQAKSPRLNLAFQRPYLFNSALGLNINFELYKRDSFFLNLRSQAGLQYNISSKQLFTVFVQFNQTNILSVDTNIVKITKRLPDVSDMSTLGLSFQYDLNTTNYRFNPKGGNELQFLMGFGKKKLRENTSILQIKDPSFDYASLYDTVKLNSYFFRFTFAGARYFPLGKQATFKAALHAGFLQSPNYYDNELYQIGGFRLLRGFNEESIYTHRYAVGTGEYHYLLDKNSWFYVFADYGYAAYKSNSTSFDHTYLGVGTGLAFETKTGVFNIAYAVGKRNDQSFDLRQSKIHIGFISVF